MKLFIKLMLLMMIYTGYMNNVFATATSDPSYRIGVIKGVAETHWVQLDGIANITGTFFKKDQRHSSEDGTAGIRVLDHTPTLLKVRVYANRQAPYGFIKVPVKTDDGLNKIDFHVYVPGGDRYEFSKNPAVSGVDEFVRVSAIPFMGRVPNPHEIFFNISRESNSICNMDYVNGRQVIKINEVSSNSICRVNVSESSNWGEAGRGENTGRNLSLGMRGTEVIRVLNLGVTVDPNRPQRLSAPRIRTRNGITRGTSDGVATSPQLKWTSVSGANQYEIHIQGGSTNKIETIKDFSGNFNKLGNCHVFTDLAVGRYNWEVRALYKSKVGINPVESYWTTPQEFILEQRSQDGAHIDPDASCGRVTRTNQKRTDIRNNLNNNNRFRR